MPIPMRISWPSRWRHSSFRWPRITTLSFSPATTTGKNFMPRVAALLDVMQVSDIIKVECAGHLRPADLCRQCAADGEIDRRQEGHHRANLDLPGDRRGQVGSGRDCRRGRGPGISSFVGEELSKSDRPELTSAKIIISGGRAMQNRENFTKYIEPVADKLGAAMGASRAAVDAGYAPNDWQSRPDRQGGGAGALHRGRHFRRDPASGAA